MKSIHIFRAGKHRPANGSGALEFSEADLQAAAEAYDPGVHEAPIVIGHPSEDAPAWGWVESLDYAEGNLHAQPRQVADEFAEMVKAGRFKHRSASFYKPDAPSNPAPGTYYLRHVGFLGATPPSVKGLEPVQFAEPAEEVVEFADPQVTAGIVARLFRSLREAWIERDGVEAADRVLPEFSIEDLEAEARAGSASDSESQPAPAFSERNSTSNNHEADDMDPEQIEARKTELDERERQIQEREDALKQQSEEFAERERNRIHESNVAFADQLVADNKLLPKHKAAVVGILDSLDSEEASIQFAEGDENKVAPREAFKKILEDDEQIDFSEKSADKGGDLPSDSMKAQEIADRALKFQEDQAKEGRRITIVQATKHVTDQLAAAN